ncbi:DUF3375 family protein [Kribbella sp. NPDC059898]|uniref:DUF3375 family protein n=1 Tax=Kribbella sp. NPDC059898 TaxID=3346995 RepID=UPI0036646F71
MPTGWGISLEAIAHALAENPTCKLLSARHRVWVLPLFAEHFTSTEEWVSAEWFHERIAETLERVDRQGERTPEQYCSDWIDAKWLRTDNKETGRLRYALTKESLTALQIVRLVVEGGNSVSAARLGSIANAVHKLADMTNPDREAQVRRIDEQIEKLQTQREAVAAGRVRLATPEEMQQQLSEILALTRSLPADFRRLGSLVEDRHQRVARRAMVDGPTKADLVDDYLNEHDLLSDTPEGQAYRGFAKMLTSREAANIRHDVDSILDQDFAREHMTDSEREQLETMLATLLAAELRVQESYLRWTASLRRFLTRSAHGRYQRLINLADRALYAGAQWAEQQPGARVMSDAVLEIGVFQVVDITQYPLWTDPGRQKVVVDSAPAETALPAADRAALRLSAGTSPRAVARTINQLVGERHLVSGAEAFEATPPEFQRLGALVTLLDLAIAHGHVDAEQSEVVMIDANRETPLRIVLPHLVFDQRIDVGGRS